LEEEMIGDIKNKEELFKSLLQHPKIAAVRSSGLWMAIEFTTFETNKKVIDFCVQHNVLTDWFLMAPACLRISPPLIVSEQQIRSAARIIMEGIEGL
jgi:acetylornithine/N-succinyldiaminopimelate aminotransferase